MATAPEARSFVAVAIGLAMTWSSPVAAAPERTDDAAVRVVPVQVKGKLPDHVRAELDARLRDSVAEDARLLEGSAAACAADECWRALASESGADRVVQATIVVNDRDYDVRADVRDGASGSLIASVTQRCEICGYGELGDTVELLGNALRRKLDSAVATLPVLVVTTTPPGAWVRVDGEDVGTTPLELPLAEGAHDIRVSKPGHVAQLRRVTLVAGVQERVALELAPLPDAPRDARKPKALVAVGGTAVGLGVLAIGGGVGLVLMNETPQRSRCSGQNIDIEGNCKYRYTTLGGGIAAIVVGAAVLATGIALLVVARKRGRASRGAWRMDGALRF